jgi:hypothetical protein
LLEGHRSSSTGADDGAGHGWCTAGRGRVSEGGHVRTIAHRCDT